MDRRDFFQTGIIAALAAKVLSDVTLARAQAPAAQGGTASAPVPRRLIMDAYTRHLHWLRDPDEIAEAAIEMTCGGGEPTVQPYPGHINPEKVVQELPAFVRTMQKHGLRVKQVRGGNQTDVSAPNLEPMVATMGQLGGTHYWVGTDNYDLTKPIMPHPPAARNMPLIRTLRGPFVIWHRVLNIGSSSRRHRPDSVRPARPCRSVSWRAPRPSCCAHALVRSGGVSRPRSRL